MMVMITVMLPNSNAEVVDLVRKLTEHFLRGSVKFSLDFNEIDCLTLEVQEAFLNSTIHLTRFKKYPLNNDFCRIFFKKLIAYLETREQDIHDEIYLFLCSEMEKPPDIDGFCYRHHVIKNNINNIITIKETKNMVVHGTTGMKTWEAAFMLSDWALCNERLIENKTLLELGSGVGFTGVAIAKYCNIKSIMLSDCHEEVLSTIKDNVRINLPNFLEETKPNIVMFNEKKKSLGVMTLDWNCVKDIPNNIVPDIILGADIVYDPSILPALCNILQMFFQKNNELDVYIASVIRNKDTFRLFLDALDKSGLKYEEISLLQPVCVGWDHKIDRKFIKIKCK